MKATLTFPVQAGVLVRGQIRRAIERYCFSRGLDCEVRENKGLIESDYYFTIHGESEKIKQAHKELELWSQSL